MAAKLNEASYAALAAISEANPGAYWWTREPSYISRVWTGFSPATLKALVRKGLAEFKPGYEASYFIRITEDGRLALEQHRERTGYYTA